jgi:hypothetical protein
MGGPRCKLLANAAAQLRRRNRRPEEAMPPLEPRDHRISLTEAAAHTKRHRQTITGKSREADHAGAFHGNQVMALLAQKGCVALRVYHGRNEKGHRSIVLVGMDQSGNDMTKECLEVCFPCPPFCGGDNSLNTG